MLTNVPHETALMAHALGQAGDLKGFRDHCRTVFLSGSSGEAADMAPPHQRGGQGPGVRGARERTEDEAS